MRTLSFAHLSDFHLPGARWAGGGSLALALQAGSDPARRLACCLEGLSASPPDFVLLTGDLVHEGDAADYARLRALFDRWLPGVPVAAALGNHDDRAAFRAGFLGQPGRPGPYLAVQEVAGVCLISLDSAYARGMDGTLPEGQLDWLADQLGRPAPRGALLLAHHPLWAPIGPLAMPMPDRLASLLGQGKVRGVFTGHIHSAFAGTVQGVPQFTAGSLGFGITITGQSQRYHLQADYWQGWLQGPGQVCGALRQVAAAGEVFLEKPLA